MLIKLKSSFILIVLISLLSGCYTEAERREMNRREAQRIEENNRRLAAMSPLDRCLYDIDFNYDLRSCRISAITEFSRPHDQRILARCDRMQTELRQLCLIRHK